MSSGSARASEQIAAWERDAEAHVAAGRADLAADLLERALVLRIRSFGAGHQSLVPAAEVLARACNHAVSADLRLGRALAPAEGRLRRLLALLTDASGAAAPDVLAPCFNVTLSNLASLHQRLGNQEAALLCLREALPLCSALVPSEAAATHLSLCALLSQMGQHAEGAHHAAEAVKLGEADILDMPSLQRDQGQSGARTALLREKVSALAVAYNNLAVQREFLGQCSESLVLYEKAVVLAEGHMEPDNALLAKLRESHRNATQTAAERRAHAGRRPALGPPRHGAGRPSGARRCERSPEALGYPPACRAELAEAPREVPLRHEPGDGPEAAAAQPAASASRDLAGLLRGGPPRQRSAGPTRQRSAGPRAPPVASPGRAPGDTSAGSLAGRSPRARDHRQGAPRPRPATASAAREPAEPPRAVSCEPLPEHMRSALAQMRAAQGTAAAARGLDPAVHPAFAALAALVEPAASAAAPASVARRARNTREASPARPVPPLRPAKSASRLRPQAQVPQAAASSQEPSPGLRPPWAHPAGAPPEGAAASGDAASQAAGASSGSSAQLGLHAIHLEPLGPLPKRGGGRREAEAEHHSGRLPRLAGAHSAPSLALPALSALGPRAGKGLVAPALPLQLASADCGGRGTLGGGGPPSGRSSGRGRACSEQRPDALLAGQRPAAPAAGEEAALTLLPQAASARADEAAVAAAAAAAQADGAGDALEEGLSSRRASSFADEGCFFQLLAQGSSGAPAASAQPAAAPQGEEGYAATLPLAATPEPQTAGPAATPQAAGPAATPQPAIAPESEWDDFEPDDFEPEGVDPQSLPLLPTEGYAATLPLGATLEPATVLHQQQQQQQQQQVPQAAGPAATPLEPATASEKLDQSEAVEGASNGRYASPKPSAAPEHSAAMEITMAPELTDRTLPLPPSPPPSQRLLEPSAAPEPSAVPENTVALEPADGTSPSAALRATAHRRPPGRELEFTAAPEPLATPDSDHYWSLSALPQSTTASEAAAAPPPIVAAEPPPAPQPSTTPETSVVPGSPAASRPTAAAAVRSGGPQPAAVPEPTPTPGPTAAPEPTAALERSAVLDPAAAPKSPAAQQPPAAPEAQDGREAEAATRPSAAQGQAPASPDLPTAASESAGPSEAPEAPFTGQSLTAELATGQTRSTEAQRSRAAVHIQRGWRRRSAEVEAQGGPPRGLQATESSEEAAQGLALAASIGQPPAGHASPIAREAAEGAGDSAAEPPAPAAAPAPEAHKLAAPVPDAHGDSDSTRETLYDSLEAVDPGEAPDPPSGFPSARQPGALETARSLPNGLPGLNVLESVGKAPAAACAAWSCGGCGFLNEVSPDMCVLCDAMRPESRPAPPPSA